MEQRLCASPGHAVFRPEHECCARSRGRVIEFRFSGDRHHADPIRLGERHHGDGDLHVASFTSLPESSRAQPPRLRQGITDPRAPGDVERASALAPLDDFDGDGRPVSLRSLAQILARDRRHAEKMVEILQDSPPQDFRPSSGWAWLYIIDRSASR